MKFAMLLFAAVMCAAPPAAGEESFQGALQRGSAAHSSLYSFSDLYRLAVSGTASGYPMVVSTEAPIRTAAAQPPVQIAVSDSREPQLGLLLLSGIALAMWVARRRLGYAF